MIQVLCKERKILINSGDNWNRWRIFKTFNDEEPSVQIKIQENIHGGVTDTGYVIFEKFSSDNFMENDPHPLAWPNLAFLRVTREDWGFQEQTFGLCAFHPELSSTQFLFLQGKGHYYHHQWIPKIHSWSMVSNNCQTVNNCQTKEQTNKQKQLLVRFITLIWTKKSRKCSRNPGISWSRLKSPSTVTFSWSWDRWGKALCNTSAT